VDDPEGSNKQKSRCLLHCTIPLTGSSVVNMMIKEWNTFGFMCFFFRLHIHHINIHSNEKTEEKVQKGKQHMIPSGKY